MTTLEEIKAPVASYVERFHSEFEQILQAKSQWLQTAVEHLSQSAGKMIRPIMTSLMAGLITPELPSKAIDAAILLELIHTATLIHDDVIDEASKRRGRPTLNAIFDNRVAVLMGDFVLSSALISAIATRDLRIIGIVSSIGRELTEGEIRQFETADSVVLDEAVYLEVIRQKTAVLFRACAEVAAISAEADEVTIAQLAECGECLGMAFQIRDDIFDYYSQDVGKPTGHDICEGKVTLPLLHCLIEDGGRTSLGARALQILRDKDFTPEHIDLLLSFAKDRGGIAYAEQQMQAYVTHAQEILHSFPESVYRTALLALADFIQGRSQ